MQPQVVQMPSVTSGGYIIEKPFIRVVFQSGLPREVGVNGCRVEHVLDVALERLQQYQTGPLACAENEEAIRHLRLARQALELRIRRREEQGVLNTFSQHENVRTEDAEEDFSATGA